MAIGNAERAMSERSEELTFYHDITSRMVSSLDLDETLTAILRGVTEMVGVDFSVLFLADHDSGALRTRKSYGHHLPEWEELELPLDEGVNAQAMQTGDLQRIDDSWHLQNEGRAQIQLIHSEPVRSMVVAPLVRGGRRLGTLAAYRRNVEPFDDRAMFVLGLLADHAGIALDHALTYQELEGARQRLEHLLANTEAIWRPMPFDETARLAAQQAANMLPGVQVMVAIVPPDSQRSFRLVAGVGPWPDDMVGTLVPFESTLASRCIAEMRTIETTAIREPGESLRSRSADHTVETSRLIPLTTDQPLPDGRTALGVLGFYRGGGRPFATEERELMDEFGKRVSLALHRAELLEAAQTTAERLQTGIEVAVELAASLDLPEITRRVLRRAVTAVQAGRGNLMRVDGEFTVLEDSYDVLGLPDSVGYRQPIDEQPLMQRAIATRLPVAGGAFDPSRLPSPLRESLADVRHTATIPMLLNDQVTAILVLCRRTERPFGPGDLAILQLIGNQAVLALRNARLFVQAQEASRAKSDFLNLAAHELRTPLSVISGYLSMFLDGSLGSIPETWKQPLATLSDKAAELAQLVDDLLLAARLEAGPVQINAQPLDAREAATQALDRAAARAELLGARMTTSLPPDAVTVVADPEHLARVLDNLVNNALSYSLGPPWIRVEVFGGPQPKILVEDRGRGIAPAMREQIFDRFVRVEDPLGHPEPGTGLGLFISRDLAQRMGGALWLEWSEPGHGSLFVLSLRPSAGTA
jgi:signal transduction histidine kinase/putative methionine-R-sulfoxide reductase with GAF domain